MRQTNCSREPASSTRPVVVEPLESRRLSAAHQLLRIGVMGDSYSDEYKYYPPDRSHAQNWVQQLAHNSRASFGALSTRSRGTPRNQGYAEDWALSGATSADLPIQTGGLTAEAAAGKVDVVTLLIGGNDFLNLLEGAATDPSADASTLTSIQSTAQTVTTNIRTAVDTILAASPTVKVVIATLPPVSKLPLIAEAEALEALAGNTEAAALVTAADTGEAQVNSAITAFATTSTRIAIADFAGVAAAFDAPTYTIGKFTLNATVPGDTPRHLFLADGIHPGTVAQGLLANTFVNAIDSSFGEKIKPLTTHQILVDARLAS